MRTSTLLARNLAWYWRTNLAVLLGVATATGVLAGALLVGESVRASLRHLVLSRLGNTESVVTSEGFFREGLAEELGSACPIIAMDGMARHEPSGRRATEVQVYGVDERFWKFQGETGAPPAGREILVSAALGAELGSKPDDTILLRVQKPSAIPLESLHGRKDDVGKTIRLTMKAVMPREFSLRAQQGDVRAVYVPLARLQRELEQPGRVNTALVADRPDLERVLKSRYRLADAGLRLRLLEKQGCWSLESEGGVINDRVAEIAASTAQSLGLATEPVLTYLANSMRVGSREVPYSVVTALVSELAPPDQDGITLNAWTAKDLGARPGDALTLEYYVWRPDGRLDTARADFRVSRIVPLEGAAADRDLTPDYPGITTSETLHDWDPPFPLDLARIRPIDEDYWKQYRATPKAFIRLARGRELWGTRFGSVTSLRIAPPSDRYEHALRNALDPAEAGLTIIPARAQGLAAAQGATDFGEYFVYFSFFLMVSALLLTGLFFKLGVEQRMREIGVLRALGFGASNIRKLFVLEGAVLSGAGALVGIAAALGYCALILYGLRTWWVDAVGTRLLTLHVSIPSLAMGAAVGLITGLGTIAWTLRRLQMVTPRALVAGDAKPRQGPWRLRAGSTAAAVALALLAATGAGKLNQAAGFFGAGTLLLVAALLFLSAWLRARAFGAIGGHLTLGLRSATYRPGRTVLCIALIASATFLIVSLDAFRRDGASEGTGGFPLMAESVLPIIQNPDTLVEDARFVSFRLRPGDDASCLNLYQPRNPRIMAPPPGFLRTARFAFQGSLTPVENPWLLLESSLPDGAIPAIADANSMTYVLHRKLGEDFVMGSTRFRLVAALRDSLFQGELLISEQNFLRLFPDVQGYRFFLLNAKPEAAGTIEEALSDYGFDIQSTEARLASFHRVENTYLSTFRALGGLGLVLGTVGLAAILLRNVLERRKELALLRAVGYRPRHLAAMVLAENVLLLVLGLATGTVCALLAVAPTVSQRGGHLPVLSLVVLLGTVLAAGLIASLAATTAALRSPLLAALRSE
jgi:ABC-type lipoprotein release transport system permease subunit